MRAHTLGIVAFGGWWLTACFVPTGVIGRQDGGPDGGGGGGDGGSCAGCVDSSGNCRTGTSPLACGTGGVACQLCGTGNVCTASGQCESPDGGPPQDAGTPTCSSGTVSPAPQACAFTDAGASFPSFDNCCNSDTDCAVAAYQYICCGDVWAMGINVSAVSAFDNARADWACAGCACASGGIHTQDGQHSGGFATVAVSCIHGVCLTQQGASQCQPDGNACLQQSDCCSNNCIVRGLALPGFCCVQGGCP
jgi:hypothetical protein